MSTLQTFWKPAVSMSNHKNQQQQKKNQRFQKCLRKCNFLTLTPQNKEQKCSCLVLITHTQITVMKFFFHLSYFFIFWDWGFFLLKIYQPTQFCFIENLSDKKKYFQFTYDFYSLFPFVIFFRKSNFTRFGCWFD